MKDKLNISFYTFVTYVSIIGLGMFSMFHFFGARYASSEMFNAFWIVEIVLSILVITVVKKYFSWKEIGFVDTDKKQLVWLLPFVFTLIVMFYAGINSVYINGISDSNSRSIVLIGITTLMVGFSEEVMFRGIIFNSLLKKYSKVKSVLISSLAFGLLHTVNIFAGLSFKEMIVQFVLTTIYGLLFALIFLRIKSIIPLIIFHWLWDFIVISISIIGYETIIPHGAINLIEIILEITFVIILFVLLIKKEKNNVRL